MADLNTIPTQSGTEIVRVLLTRVAAASQDWRSSNGNVTLSGDRTLDDAVVVFDGINPYNPGENQGAVRLRRTSGAWNTYFTANPTLRLLMAVENEAPREGTSHSIGGGFWNWQFADEDTLPAASTLGAGSTIALVMWLPPGAFSDASFAAESGDPTLTLTPDTGGYAVLRDASFEAEAGDPSLTIAPSADPFGDASFAAATGTDPTLTMTPDAWPITISDAAFMAMNSEAVTDSDAGFEAATGDDPSLTIAPDNVAVTTRDASFYAESGS